MKPLPPIIFEQTLLSEATPGVMDFLWAKGWRHFGREFFRYSISFDDDGQRVIQPLRLDLAKFELSKSQRRVLRKNADLSVKFVPASLHDEVCDMFQRHKSRFVTNIPDHLSNFLGDEPGMLIPCHECQVWLHDRLIAASFLEASNTAGSGVYGVFEPEFSERSLGVFTMLSEIQWCQEQGLRYYYSGYATREPSHYDYKKKFSCLEIYDWATEGWVPFLPTAAGGSAHA
jgi:arginyl-tRNA--protein-N-Asp/Glu arginylyltransferase